MKTLILMRHAKSSWDDDTLSDHDRPLNKRGAKAAPKMGKLLRREKLCPDYVVSSTALRALSTARAAAKACGFRGDVAAASSLYLADPQSHVEALAALPDEPTCVMIVTHNPGIEEFLEQLTGVYERMPTAAVAVISLPVDRWSELSTDTPGALLNLWRPRDLE